MVLVVTPEQKARVGLLCDALESGEYRQGQFQLTRNGEGEDGPSFCCLGVACEVAIRNGLEVAIASRECEATSQYLSNPMDVRDPHVGIHYDGSWDVMPQSVQEWFGFECGNPDLFLSEEEEENLDSIGPRCAAELNDDLGWDFKQISAAFRRTHIPETLPEGER